MRGLKIAARIKRDRLSIKQLYLSVLAGMSISLGCIGLAFVRSDSPLSYACSGVLGGFIFSFGLFTIFALGLELFTGNCILFSSFINEDIGLKDFLKILGYTLFGNVTGCLLIWLIFSFSKFSYTNVLTAMGNAKVDLPALVLFSRGVLCNIVISLATLMNMHGNSTQSKFLSACLPVIVFVACGFEHSIADAFILLFSTQDLISVFLCFSIVLFGNVLGGIIVATCHYFIMYGATYIEETR